MPKTILVTGASGQLGQELQQLAKGRPDDHFIFTDRHNLDITQEETVIQFFSEHQPDFCINCAAYTAVDKAESEREQAFLINDEAAGFLAKACRKQGAALLHLSSDYVYHNQLNRPLQETDPCSPQGIYAQSKLAGERRAMENYPATIVLRTSWVYSSFGHNFVKTMLRLGVERDQLKVVYDQVGAPTYAYDIAHILLHIIDQGAHTSGIFNFANTGVTSWFDFANAIFEIKDLKCQVYPILSSGYPTPAPRPHFSLLDCTKINTTYKPEINHWRTSLKACLAKL
jgi:dTDP-4-dehydrorhamnose reductase